MSDEDQLIESFITKEKRERYRSKLASKEKRHEFLDRLNHSPDFDEQFVQWLPSGALPLDLLRQHGASETCTMISADGRLDGQEMPLHAAIEAVALSGCGTILSCIRGKLAYYEGEDGERRAILFRN